MLEGAELRWVLSPAGCHVGWPSSLLSPLPPSTSAHSESQACDGGGELGVAVSSEEAKRLLPAKEEVK